MTVISVDEDRDQLTLTLIADFQAPIAQVWRLWADPRRLERWWGPPGYPATVVAHDLTPGGAISYYMTGPNGQTHHGWWRVTAVEAPRFLEFTEGFADQSGEPIPDAPSTTMLVRLFEHDGGTRMELRSAFHSPEGMERLLTMGMAEGLREAVGQMDSLLVVGTG